MKPIIVLTLAIAFAAGCKRDTQPAPNAAVTPAASAAATPAPTDSPARGRWKTVEEFAYAWTSGQAPVRFRLEIPGGYRDPGDFTRIRIQVSGQPEFVLDNRDGWIEYNSQEQESEAYAKLKAVNLVQSKYVLILPASNRKGEPPLVFLRSWGYASDAERLHVIGFKPSGEALLLFDDELDLSEVRDLDGDGYVEFTGTPCMAESLGWNEDYELATYVPEQVFKVPQPVSGMAVLSESLTKQATIARVGGWAGAGCNDEHIVVWPKSKDKNPQLVNKQEAEELRKTTRQQ